MDNRLIFLYYLIEVMGGRRSERSPNRRNCSVKSVGILNIGKSVFDAELDSTISFRTNGLILIMLPRKISKR